MRSARIGQNFLVNKNIAEKIVASFLPADGEVLEIGPGKGVLTRLLLQQKLSGLTVVELDEKLSEKLKTDFGNNIRLINRDILAVNLKELYPATEGISIIGNIPYYISKEIINWIFNQGHLIKKGALMMQKEFVAKVRAEPDSKYYNAQSVMFNFLFTVQKEFDVSPGSFFPPPKVMSSVFSFNTRGQPETDHGPFYRFLQTCFAKRRKTLLNNLLAGYNRDQLEQIFLILTWEKNIRAEQISGSDFFTAFQILAE